MRETGRKGSVTLALLCVSAVGCDAHKGKGGAADKGSNRAGAALMETPPRTTPRRRPGMAKPTRPRRAASAVNRCADVVVRCPTPSPLRGMKLASAAYAAMRSKEWAKGVCLARQALREDGGTSEFKASSAYNLGRCWEELGCRTEARAAFETAVLRSTPGRTALQIRCRACWRLSGTCTGCDAQVALNTWPLPYGLFLGMKRTEAKKRLALEKIGVLKETAVRVHIGPSRLDGRPVAAGVLRFDAEGQLQGVTVILYVEAAKAAGAKRAWGPQALARRYRTTFRSTRSREHDVLTASVKGVTLRVTLGRQRGTFAFE